MSFGKTCSYYLYYLANILLFFEGIGMALIGGYLYKETK